MDLRTPAGRPSFDGVRRLRDLTREQARWLATQEGFSGAFVRNGAFFEWRRALDFQPDLGLADAGSLTMEGDVLVERGRDVDYLEHWRPSRPTSATPVQGFALRDPDDGRAGCLVRVGGDFMYARDRAGPVPAGAPLLDVANAAPDLLGAQDVVDMELSRGEVSDDGVWRVTRSSLPFREGCDLRIAVDRAGGTVLASDQTPEGAAFIRRWTIVDHADLSSRG